LSTVRARATVSSGPLDGRRFQPRLGGVALEERRDLDDGRARHLDPLFLGGADGLGPPAGGPQRPPLRLQPRR
jgi:hypothetical protein